MKKTLTKRSENYSQWYLDVVETAELAENSPVRGCMVIKPHGYAIWERIQHELDRMIKETGHSNAYFPVFIPKSFFDKEAEHVEGFAKESAVVTHYRLQQDATTGKLRTDPDAKLTEELIVRPTSETVIYDTYARWIQSYRDLPLLINQWANVVRWEMRTRPFLRTAEFLWQEGHTVHATQEGAEEETKKMLGVYQTLLEDYLAIPSIAGKKSPSETFAGADHTYTLESMMQDGKALQSCTSHNLGQNFAKSFNIQFTDENEKQQYAWQTSWGLSTRVIGALIMSHSDDLGLVLPPNIAPIQVVLIPITPNKEDEEEVLSVVTKIEEQLKAQGVRTHLDSRAHISPGAKFGEWEKKGIPVRIEIGPKDIAKNTVVVARRDNQNKHDILLEQLADSVKEILQEMQVALLTTARERLTQHTIVATNYQELKEGVENGKFVLAHWDGTAKTEEKIKAETKATIRCIPFDGEKDKGSCIISGKPSKQQVVFAKAY
ncbi:MAG: proline--tRNA ligase [Pseudomonadales bacterium]|nr:proline--tRNA ligase [Candidatus Woesebacteria bacterium]MCB9802059.1 proline--tRNA ligase [Pseudomonadales bacterium]